MTYAELEAKWRERALDAAVRSIGATIAFNSCADELSAVRQAQQGAGEIRPAGGSETMINALDVTAMVLAEGFNCSLCGHRHAGRSFAFICVGCPCEALPPAADPVPAGAPREEGESLTARAAQLLEGITPGQWHAPGMGEVHSDHDAGVYARIVKGSVGDEQDPVVADGCNEADAVFIAAAPQLVRDLRARVREVEEELADARSTFRSFAEHHAATELSWDADKRRAEAAEAEVQRLREALRTIEADLRSMQRVAGQSSVEELDSTLAGADARFAEYVGAIADRLAALTAGQEPSET